MLLSVKRTIDLNVHSNIGLEMEKSSEKNMYKKKSLWISSHQDQELKSLEQLTGLKQSEHMRRALDDYIKKLKMEEEK